MAIKIERLTQKVWLKQQAVCYEALWRIGAHKVRIDIERDAYTTQSFARAMLFDGTKWNVLVSTPVPQTAMKDLFYQEIKPQKTQETFERDEKTLLDEAKTILL